MKTRVNPLHTPVELLRVSLRKKWNCANFLVLWLTQGAQRPHSGTVEMRCIFIVIRTQCTVVNTFSTVVIIVTFLIPCLCLSFCQHYGHLFISNHETVLFKVLFKLVCTNAKKKTCDVPVNKNMNGCCKSTRPTYALCGIETGVWTEHTWSLKVLHSAEISNIKHFSRHILVKTYLQVKNWTDVIVTISTSLQYILIPSCSRSTKKELQLKTYRNKNGLLSCSVLFSAIMLANADWMLYYFCWCPTRTLFKCKWVNKYRFLFPDLFH